MVTTVLRTRGGRLDAGDRKAFEAFRSRVAGAQSPRVLLHLHGGLVDQAAAETKARRLSGSDAGSYRAPHDWEQVYVVWRTGALETLKENWRDLATNDRLYKVLLRRLISIVSGKLRSSSPGGRSVSEEKALTPAEIERRLDGGDDAPFADVDEAMSSPAGGSRGADVDTDAEADLRTDLHLDTDIEGVGNDIEAYLAQARPVSRTSTMGDPSVGADAYRRLDRSVQEHLTTEADAASSRGVLTGEIVRRIVEHGVSIGLRVLTRYRTGRDHGLQATVAEEIVRELYGDLVGSIIWGMMRGDASDHFAPGGFGTELLEALVPSGESRPHVMVVGHSAGSILATALLIRAAGIDPALTFDLVFLAPAVRTLHFARALDLSERRIARFRSFVMLDEVERADVLLGKGWGFVYPSSLLYLVSGLFEEHASAGLADAPLLGMARFLDADSGWLRDPGEGAALGRVQDFLGRESQRLVRSIATGGQGLNSAATSHGGFDDDPQTFASVVAMLSEPR